MANVARRVTGVPRAREEASGAPTGRDMVHCIGDRYCNRLRALSIFLARGLAVVKILPHLRILDKHPTSQLGQTLNAACTTWQTAKVSKELETLCAIDTGLECVRPVQTTSTTELAEHKWSGAT